MKFTKRRNRPNPFPARQVRADKDLVDALCDDANLPLIEIWEYMRALARSIRELERQAKEKK